MSNTDWSAAVTHFGQGFPNRIYYDGNEYVIQGTLVADGIRYITLTGSTGVNWIAGLAIEIGQE